MPWNQESPYASFEAFQHRVRGLARRYNSLVERISEIEFLADSIQLELAQLTGSEKSRRPGESMAGRERGTQRQRRAMSDFALEARDALRRTAEAGVTKVDLKTRSDGLADVSIDDGRAFALPPALTELLAVLILENGFGDDSFVGWKTLDEIGVLLKKRSGKAYTRHALTQGIYRLRNELYRRGGVNPYLVQTNARLGARFALKRKSTDSSTSPNQPAAQVVTNKGRDEWHISG